MKNVEWFGISFSSFLGSNSILPKYFFAQSQTRTANQQELFKKIYYFFILNLPLDLQETQNILN